MRLLETKAFFDIKKPIVIISGDVSTGKTPYAKKIETIGKEKGINISIYDHDIFDLPNAKKINSASKKKLFQIINEVNQNDSIDMAVITIGTGCNSGRNFTIEILGHGFNAMRFFQLLFDDEIERAKKCIAT
ncbi:MAG: hypothetical protein AB7S75_05530 [Desulfococcaceae bacterium]